MPKIPTWAQKILDRDIYQCQECGSDKDIVIYNKEKVLCRLCYAEIRKLSFKVSNPNITVIIELQKQGKTNTYIARFLGISRVWLGEIVKRG